MYGKRVAHNQEGKASGTGAEGLQVKMTDWIIGGHDDDSQAASSTKWGVGGKGAAQTKRGGGSVRQWAVHDQMGGESGNGAARTTLGVCSNGAVDDLVGVGTRRRRRERRGKRVQQRSRTRPGVGGRVNGAANKGGGGGNSAVHDLGRG